MFIVDTGRTQQRVNNFLRMLLRDGGGRQAHLIQGENPALAEWLMHASQYVLDRVWAATHRANTFNSRMLSDILGGFADIDGNPIDRSNPAYAVPLWQRPINAPSQQDLRTIGHAYQQHAVQQAHVQTAILAVGSFHRDHVLREYDETAQSLPQIKADAARRFAPGSFALVRASYNRETGNVQVQDIH